MPNPEGKAEEEDGVKDENWMALARRRAERVGQTTLGENMRKRRDEGEAAMTRNTAALKENGSKEVNQKYNSLSLGMIQLHVYVVRFNVFSIPRRLLIHNPYLLA